MDFKEELLKLNINLTSEDFAKFEKYYSFLISYNEKVNLTNIVEYDEVYIKHFYDSLTLLNSMDLSGKKILDVGAGAGFPSIPCAIINKDIDVTIIDALNKRITFLNELINLLDLKNAKAIHKRAEEYANDFREYYDILTARAVARLNMLAELCLPLLKVGGYFLVLKGLNADDELKEASNAISLLGGKYIKTLSYDLPLGMGDNHKIIVIKKVKETPKKYPRAFAQIKKSPLR